MNITNLFKSTIELKMVQFEFVSNGRIGSKMPSMWFFKLRENIFHALCLH